MGGLIETTNIEEASYIMPLVNIQGITANKIYDLQYGEIKDGFDLGDEYHIVDDYDRRNHGVMFLKSKLFKDNT